MRAGQIKTTGVHWKASLLQKTEMNVEKLTARSPRQGALSTMNTGPSVSTRRRGGGRQLAEKGVVGGLGS